MLAALADTLPTGDFLFEPKWDGRPDKSPRACRYDQLEITTPYELRKVFSSGSSGS